MDNLQFVGDANKEIQSVPLRTLQKCGFRSVREARKTLYCRVKVSKMADLSSRL
jgi:hypothetical protein